MRSILLALLVLTSSSALADEINLTVVDVAVTDGGTANTSAVSIKIDRDSARRMGEFTAARIGKVVELRVGGRLVTAPVVRSEISTQQLTIGGSYSATEAQTLAEELLGGKAKVSLGDPS